MEGGYTLVHQVPNANGSHRSIELNLPALPPLSSLPRPCYPVVKSGGYTGLSTLRVFIPLGYGVGLLLAVGYCGLWKRRVSPLGALGSVQRLAASFLLVGWFLLLYFAGRLTTA